MRHSKMLALSFCLSWKVLANWQLYCCTCRRESMFLELGIQCTLVFNSTFKNIYYSCLLVIHAHSLKGRNLFKSQGGRPSVTEPLCNQCTLRRVRWLTAGISAISVARLFPGWPTFLLPSRCNVDICVAPAVVLVDGAGSQQVPCICVACFCFIRFFPSCSWVKISGPRRAGHICSIFHLPYSKCGSRLERLA